MWMTSIMPGNSEGGDFSVVRLKASVKWMENVAQVQVTCLAHMMPCTLC